MPKWEYDIFHTCLQPNILADIVGKKVHTRWFLFKYLTFLIQICRRWLSLCYFTAECSCSVSSRCYASLLDPLLLFKLLLVHAVLTLLDFSETRCEIKMSHCRGNLQPALLEINKSNIFIFTRLTKNVWLSKCSGVRGLINGLTCY